MASPSVEMAAIEVETILGLWLLSGWSMRAAWGAALTFFGILASVSLYQAVTGQRYCGCLGRVEVSPWPMFALDVAVMAVLAVWRPAPGGEARPVAWLNGLLKTAGGAALFFVLISGAFLLAFDNPSEALAMLRGESMTVEPAVRQSQARSGPSPFTL